jgi:hypothetical protein
VNNAYEIIRRWKRNKAGLPPRKRWKKKKNYVNALVQDLAARAGSHDSSLGSFL